MQTHINSESVRELINRRRHQFLVNSFIYYVLNENIISDSKFDEICRDLVRLQREYPDIAKELPYHDICSQVDESASGGYISEYPAQVIDKALYLLRNRGERFG